MIEIRKSPLKVVNSFVESFSFKFTEAESPVNWKEMSDKWSITIEYFQHNHKIEANNFMLRCKICVNNDSMQLPGYSIEVVNVTLFKIEDADALSEMHIKNLRTTSALSIAIQNVRAVIANFSAANGVIGKYTLPPIDMAHLLAQSTKPGEKRTLKGKKKL